VMGTGKTRQWTACESTWLSGLYDVYDPDGNPVNSPMARERAEMIAAAGNAAAPEPRVGVEVTGHYLGFDDANGGANVIITAGRLTIVFGWLENGSCVAPNAVYVLELSPTQLSALSEFLADLHRCAECEAWYKAGEICPKCGAQREEATQ
jgi:hypothetical protein